MSSLKSPWNKGRSVGQRLAFTPYQIRAIDEYLSCEGLLHDRCLFMVATDSFLRCGDLLNLQVRDLQTSTGLARESFPWRQQKTNTNVVPVLTQKTRQACLDWIAYSQKQPHHYLFTRNKAIDAASISATCYRRLIKRWAEYIDLEGEQYSTHSLRRSKPTWLYEQGVSVEDISQLLGHQSTEATLRYLGLTLAKAQAEALKRDIFVRDRPHRSLSRKSSKSLTKTRKRVDNDD